MSWISVDVNTSVDVDLDDILEDIDTEELQEELSKRIKNGKGISIPLNIGTARMVRRMEAFMNYGLITNELLDELEKKSGKVIFVG